MTGFVRVAKVSEIPPGKMLPVRVEGEDLVLYNVNGTLHATRDSCTHQSFPLSKGALRGKYVRCALHGWEYDVTTGQYQGHPAIRVRCFPVKVEGDEVWISPTPLPPPAPPPVSRDEA
jgi:nitrite reductase/ring-hydroxylating ferredoxin subunit